MLLDFKNRKVEITIKEVKAFNNIENIMKFAGILNEQEAKELINSVEECRTIDIDSWQ